MNGIRVCLLTSVHLYQNPRLVKEADALHDRGYQVRVIACQWEAWMSEFDRTLIDRRPWPAKFVDYTRELRPQRYWYSRLRQYSSRRILAHVTCKAGIAERAISRVLPELARVAGREPAEIFIAHNIDALPAAARAAQRWRAKLVFDAEDFHSGMRLSATAPGIDDEIIEYIERLYLARCAYITAASEGIADAYAAKYAIRQPVPVLNMFPLAQRPMDRRHHDASDPVTLYWFSQTIGKNRGIEDVVQAIGLLTGRNIELHLVGKWQPGYRTQLFQLAAAFGVKEAQVIDHAPQQPDEMVRFAARFDVGLALEEPGSVNRDLCLTNKIFTYLLAGNTVIASATQGQSQFMKKIGGAGFLYQPGDIAALAGRIEFLYNDRTALEAARQRAWDCATREYNWDLERTKFLRVVAAAVGQEKERVS